MREIKFYRAKAKFEFKVGNKAGDIEVGSEASISKNEDDWKIALAMQAGQEISEKHKAGIQAVSLSFVNMELDKEDD